MKLLIVLCIMLSVSSFAFAESYKIETRITDYNPGDGFMDAGSPSNPYVITGESGNEVGTMQTEYTDSNPGDGWYDAGTISNSYVIDTD